MGDATVAPHPLATLVSPANLLTTVRIVAAPFLFAAVLDAEDRRGASWAVFLVGLVLAATDFFDGKVARRRGTVSRWGAFLDPLADKVVVLGVSICLVIVDRYAWIPVALIAVREVAITVYRTFWAQRGLSIPARRSAKYKTVVQGGALLIAVMPPLEDAHLLIDGALWVAVVFTLVTGLQYLADGRSAMNTSGG